MLLPTMGTQVRASQVRRFDGFITAVDLTILGSLRPVWS